MSDAVRHAATARKTDDPTASTTVLVGVLGTVIVFLICVLLHAMFLSAVDAERQRKESAAGPSELDTVRAEQLERLHGPPRWVDEERTRAAIPIDQAMERVVRDYAGSPGAGQP